jgi:prevent-host-death family protein
MTIWSFIKGLPMRSVQVVVAKAKFSWLLSRVESGESIAITRHGKVVARLVPEQPCSAADVFRRANALLAGASLVEPEDQPPEPVEGF